MERPDPGRDPQRRRDGHGLGSEPTRRQIVRSHVIPRRCPAPVVKVHKARTSLSSLPPRRKIEDMTSDRGRYLLLQVRVPFATDGLPTSDLEPPRDLIEKSAKHIDALNSESRCIDVVVDSLGIRDEEYGSPTPRYAFHWSNGERRDEASVRLAEALACGLALARAPLPDPLGPLVLWLPATLVSRGRDVTLQELVECERSKRGSDAECRLSLSEIGNVRWYDHLVLEDAWWIAVTAFRFPALFDATRFLSRSFQNFYVQPCDIDEVLSDTKRQPLTGTSPATFEDALQNAFKAIEAVLGDPPQKERRFLAKLAAHGIDGEQLVGHQDREPIRTMIHRMNEARDKRAAHGSTPNRGLTVGELLDFQDCAEFVVRSELERMRLNYSPRCPTATTE